MPYRDLEPAIARIGHDLHAAVQRAQGLRDRAEQRLLEVVIADPAARARLFQLVDAYPALRRRAEVVDHISGYLDHESVPGHLRHAVRAARRLPGGDRAAAGAARAGIARHGRPLHRWDRRRRRATSLRAALGRRPRSDRRSPGREDGHAGRRRPLRRPGGGAGRRPGLRCRAGPASAGHRHQAHGARPPPPAAHRVGGPGRGSRPTRAHPARGHRRRSPRVVRHGAVRGQGPHAGALPVDGDRPRRGHGHGRHDGRAVRGHRHPGLPARQRRRSRRARPLDEPGRPARRRCAS